MDILTALTSLVSIQLSPVQGLIVVALWILNEYLKRMMGMESKYAAGINLVAGIILNVLASSGVVGILQSSLVGFILGAVAGGLYDMKGIINNLRSK